MKKSDDGAFFYVVFMLFVGAFLLAKGPGDDKQEDTIINQKFTEKLCEINKLCEIEKYDSLIANSDSVVFDIDDKIAANKNKLDSLKREIDTLQHMWKKMEREVENSIDNIFVAYAQKVCKRGRLMGAIPDEEKVLGALRKNKGLLNTVREIPYGCYSWVGDYELMDDAHEEIFALSGCDLLSSNEQKDLALGLERDLTNARLSIQAKYSKYYPYIRKNKKRLYEYGYDSSEDIVFDFCLRKVCCPKDTSFFRMQGAKYNAVRVDNNNIVVLRTEPDGCVSSSQPLKLGSVLMRLRNETALSLDFDTLQKDPLFDGLYSYFDCSLDTAGIKIPPYPYYTYQICKNNKGVSFVAYAEYKNVKFPDLSENVGKIDTLETQCKNLQHFNDSLTKVREKVLKQKASWTSSRSVLAQQKRF